MPANLSATLRAAPGSLRPGAADLGAAADEPRGAGGMAHTMLSGLLWTILGTGARGMGQLLVLIVLARLLTVRDFGIVNAALVVLGVAVTISQFAVAPAMVQIPDLRMTHIRVAFTLSLLLGVALLGLTWWSADLLARFFRLEPLAAVLRTMSLCFPLQAAFTVAEFLLQRKMRFRLLAILDAVTYALGYGLIGIGLALLGFGFWAFVAAYCAQIVARAAFLLIIQPHPMIPLLERRALQELVRFGGGMMLAKLANYAAGQGDSAVVVRSLGAEALGLYGRAIQLMVMPAMYIGDVLDRVLFPGMARFQDDPEQLGLAYGRAVALIALVAIPVSAGLLVLAPEIVRVLLGPKWTGITAPLQIFAAAMLFRTSYKISDATVRAAGAVYQRASRQAIYALLVVAGAWAGTRWGLVGVAVGVSGAIVVNFLLMAHLTLSMANLSWAQFWRAHLPGAALALIVALQLEAVSALFRQWQAPPLLTLSIAIATALATLPLLLHHAPRLFLGRDGTWLLQLLRPYTARHAGLTGCLRWILREPA